MNPTDHDIASYASITFYVIGSIAAVVVAFAALRRTPPIEHDMALIKENLRAEIDTKFDDFRNELNGRLTGLSQKIEARTGELHTQIAANNTAGEERVNGLRDQLTTIIEKIGELRAGKVDKK